MNKDPLNFGVSGIFGRMGQNPSINALTNANALAQQQMAQQQGAPGGLPAPQGPPSIAGALGGI